MMTGHGNRWALALACLLSSTAALAQEAPQGPIQGAAQDAAQANSAAAPSAPAPAASPITINGSVTIASEYRYRGVSYTDNNPTAQVFLTVSHESGLYLGFFGSNLSGYGSYGGDNLEADIYAGWVKSVGKLTFDTGVWRYQFPGVDGYDFYELYSSASHPIGPGKIKAGFYYAPKQRAIGSKDDLSVYADGSMPIAHTPITLRGHVGYTTGSGSTVAGPTGHYFDYLVGAEVTWKNFTFNVSYVDTSINRQKADIFYYIGGRRVIDGAALFSLTAAF